MKGQKAREKARSGGRKLPVSTQEGPEAGSPLSSSQSHGTREREQAGLYVFRNV